MFRIFEFKGGKFSVLPDVSSGKIKNTISAIIIIFIISSISGFLKIEEKELWKMYEVVIDHFALNLGIPEVDTHDKNIEARIELEVDKAIREYQLSTKEFDFPTIPKPIVIEEPLDKFVCYSEECLKLGGEIRMCSPWIEGCDEDLKK